MSSPALAALRAIFLSVPFAALLSVPALAQSSARAGDDWSRFVAPADLSALMAADQSVQVIDIRDEKYVAKGVVPGAVWVHYKEWRGPSERPGQPPTELELEELLGSNGVRLDQPIAVYNHSGKTIQTGRAAIVYWLLKSAGAENVAIVEGGFKGWQAAELPADAAPADLPVQSVDLTYSHDWWAGPIEVYGVTTGQIEGAILDARLDGQVRKSIETGKPMMSMPMAQYIPASLFTNPLSERALSEEGREAFLSALADREINLGSEILISVCATGELSALSWFYASEILEIENVQYYPDALKGWEGDGGFMFGMWAE